MCTPLPTRVVEYDYATSLPNTREEKGFDSAPADLSEADPRVSMVNFTTRLERAHHQELNLSRRIGKNNIQVAVFSDRVGNTALIGTGDVTAAGGFLLPDVYSGTFTYAGDTLRAHGVRVVLAAEAFFRSHRHSGLCLRRRARPRQA